MNVFCDSSAFFSLAVPDDPHHETATEVWKTLTSDHGYRLLTTNYVVLESIALFQSRRGLVAVRAFNDSISDTVEISFVDVKLHEQALFECLHANRRDVSLVDYVSFAFMQRHGIRSAFAYDDDFTERGFKLPSPR